MTKAFFNKQHQLLRSELDPMKPIIHVYADASPYDCEHSGIWVKHLIKTRGGLERIPHKTYIHPDAGEGHWDICHLEKDVWKNIIEPLQIGDLYPAILYCYNRTYLTIAAGVHAYGSEGADLWTFYPDEKELKEYYLKLKAHNFDSRF
jgi:hypothetical protein